MKLFFASVMLGGILLTSSAFLAGGAGLSRSSSDDHTQSASSPAKIVIDYPLEGSVFPPEITPPTFVWRDDSKTAKRWEVEISFGDHSAAIRVEAPGEHVRKGEIDPLTVSDDAPPTITPEQAAMWIWKPDADTWATIKQRSVKAPATIAITGFADDASKLPVSSGNVNISTSTDRVGAPVFYRDVPLMLAPSSAKGAIQPLPPTAIPLIKWRLRNIGEPQSRVVMENLPTCANCHSF